eukprot:SAG11_NODE_14878_length_596_cov_2.171026_2_plen_141_part_00
MGSYSSIDPSFGYSRWVLHALHACRKKYARPARAGAADHRPRSTACAPQLHGDRKMSRSPASSPPSSPKRGLPPLDKLYQRMEVAGHLVRLHSAEPDLKKPKLVTAACNATGLRRDAVGTVHDNLVFCHENDIDYPWYGR